MRARCPLGFTDFEQLDRCRRDLATAMAADGARGEAYVIGTAATVFSLNLNKPEGHAFDQLGRGTSDVDIVLRSIELLIKMRAVNAAPDRNATFLGKYIWLENDGSGGFLVANRALAAFVGRWSSELKRPVDLRLLLSVPGEPSELLDMMEPSPILLVSADMFVA